MRFTTTPSIKSPSLQQQAIFSYFAKDTHSLGAALAALGLELHVDVNGNLIVRARAGTGKTTTILEGIRYAPETRIILAAFNTAIAAVLKDRVQAANPNAEAKTLHSIGFAAVRKYWENINVAADNGRARSKALVQAVCGDQVPDAIKRLVAKLLTLGREQVPHATLADELVPIAEAFDCVPDEDWEDAGFDVNFIATRAIIGMELAASTRPVEGIDFADMLFLPVRNKWMRPMYDLVVVDEAQDMTQTQLELAQGSAKGRIVIVGDDRQAIYGFRGADAGSLDRLKTELKAGELGLTITYRCPKLVVADAKQLVPDYEAAPQAPDGTIERLRGLDALMDAAGPNNFILSRKNAPLAKIAMGCLRRQKRVRIQGKNIGEGLIGLVRKLSTGAAAHSIPKFLERLTTWKQRETERAIAADRAESFIENIADKAEVLRIISEGVTGPRELAIRLEELFKDTGNHGSIVCSSVHKAKGLEAPKVFVLMDTFYPVPPKGATVAPGRALEEQNLHYVAITRAMDTLVYVTGTE